MGQRAHDDQRVPSQEDPDSIEQVDQLSFVMTRRLHLEAVEQRLIRQMEERLALLQVYYSDLSLIRVYSVLA